MENLYMVFMIWTNSRFDDSQKRWQKTCCASQRASQV